LVADKLKRQSGITLVSERKESGRARAEHAGVDMRTMRLFTGMWQCVSSVQKQSTADGAHRTGRTGGAVRRVRTENGSNGSKITVYMPQEWRTTTVNGSVDSPYSSTTSGWSSSKALLAPRRMPNQ
jgi:hypothetical protein